MSRRGGSPPSSAFKKVPLPPAPLRPSSVIPTSLDVPVPKSAHETAKCPHGGFIVNGLPYCGYCSGGEGCPETFRLFLIDLYEICGYEGRKPDPFKTLDNKEMTHHAFEKVMMKLGLIMKAKEPRAMARIVARNAVVDLRKKAYNWKEWVFSDLYDEKRAVAEDENPFIDSLLSVGAEDHEAHSLGELTNYNIPGGERLWAPAYQWRLRVALEDAMAMLPKPPQDKVPMSVSVMIKMWADAYEDVGPSSYEEIATYCGSQPHQIKYLVQKGIRIVREYILAEAAKPIREQSAQKIHSQGSETKDVKK